MSDSPIQVTVAVMDGDRVAKSYPIKNGETVIGRQGADIPLNDKRVSVRHLVMRVAGDRVYATDHDSLNGVWVNGEKVAQAEVRNLDEIRIGDTTFRIFILENLRLFRDRNLGPRESPQAESIDGLIDDELKHFSKWDLTSSAAPDVQAALALPRYRLEITSGVDAGKVYRLTRAATTIGRVEADILLNDPDISRLHAGVDLFPFGGARVRDLGSTNGTYLNGKRVQDAPARSGDEVKIGSTLFRLIQEE